MFMKSHVFLGVFFGLTDSAQMTDLYNFQSCAAYLSSLEKNTNLVNFFGAAVDNGKSESFNKLSACL